MAIDSSANTPIQNLLPIAEAYGALGSRANGKPRRLGNRRQTLPTCGFFLARVSAASHHSAAARRTVGPASTGPCVGQDWCIGAAARQPTSASKSSRLQPLEAHAREHGQARVFGETRVALAAFTQPEFTAFRRANRARLATRTT